MELRGANALLTGAAGGLGGYIARALATEGVDLVLSDLPGSGLEGLQAELRGRGVRAEAVTADLTDTSSISSLATGAEAAIGPIDILVNNAGVEFARSFGEATREELETITSVNLLALMELTRVVLPRMLSRRRGHIVNVASLAGKLPAPYLATYCATKHGVVGFTHSLRAEYGSTPLGFTAICPGFISRVGMYGRIEGLVPEIPPELSTSPPERVGEAVVLAIRDNRAELIVNSRPTRPLTVLAAAAPAALIRLLRRERLMQFARSYGEARKLEQDA